jgi:uncharacterized protein
VGDLGDALLPSPDSEKSWLLLVDELPIFVLALLRQDSTGARTRTFLNWFRQRRLDPRARDRVRWLLAGSIGLDTVTRRLGFGDTINDLYLSTNLGAFGLPTAHAFLDGLATTYDISLPHAVKERLLERAGWLIPYHLQLLFAELRAHCSDNGSTPSAEAVEAAYQALLGPSKRAYFDYWVQRLHEELGPPDDARALSLLNHIAPNPAGEPLHILSSGLANQIPDANARSATLHYLLDVLQSDGYLTKQDGRYFFRSTLLRDYWLTRLPL